MTTPLPTVIWVIPVFDSNSPSPFPLKNRTLVLEWNALNEEQVRECLEILRDRDTPLPNPSSLTSTVMSISRNTTQPDERMLSFRSFFNEKELGENCYEQRRGVWVNLNREYIEDENGIEISMHQIIQNITGCEYPIIAGEPDSVLRLPPAVPNPKSWSKESANTIAQFLEVVELIHASDWIKCTPKLTIEVQSIRDQTEIPSQESTTLLESIFPNVRETQSVLPFFRQLHSKKDRLFRKACEQFVSICNDPARNDWIHDQLISFEEMIESPPIPFGGPHSRKKIIEMYMYGARLLHSESDHGDDQKLHEFIEQQGIPRVASAFNASLWDILNYATSTYRVIKRDFDYWLQHCELERPTRIAIPNLFENVIANPKNDA
jgi:hypothetical protein